MCNGGSGLIVPSHGGGNRVALGVRVEVGVVEGGREKQPWQGSSRLVSGFQVSALRRKIKPGWVPDFHPLYSTHHLPSHRLPRRIKGIKEKVRKIEVKENKKK